MKKWILTLSLGLVTCCFKTNAQQFNPISQMLDNFEKELGFNGVVLISKGDSILFHQAYGAVDSKSQPTDKNAIYHIASISKAFTALAILKLVEENRLGLQDALVKFFPTIPPDKGEITIHQLLSHQSGIPQTYVAEGSNDAQKAAHKIWKIPSAPPGKFTYSNGNYTLLAIIIETVTNKSWEDYITEAILIPLEMTNTYFWADENTTGLPEIKPSGKSRKRKRDYGYLGSTGIFSTATDLVKFHNALESDIILNDSIRALWSGQYVKLRSDSAVNTDFYAYGLFLTEGEISSKWFRGNEENWGVSIMYWFPHTNTSIIVLSNRENLSNGEKQHMFVSAQIIKALFY